MRNLLLIPLLLSGALVTASAKLTPLAPKPDWSLLDKFQQTITQTEFSDLLNRIYAPNQAADEVITITPAYAKILTSDGRAPYILKFATSAESARPVPKFWRSHKEISASTSEKPLSGLKIAIDPGHIGGKWAKMEERWFQIGKSQPVIEGDMTLKVAKMLVPRLKSLGAEVHLTRANSEPLTKLRPAQLRKNAITALQERGSDVTEFSVTKESEKLFYRTAEIRQRADLVNNHIRPDLVLCLHFNAEDWGNPAKPSLVEKNHLHFLITGAWNSKELEYEDQRFDMLVKLLNRTFPEENGATRSLTRSMTSATHLPPFIYHGPAAVRIGDSDYIWGRNLLANRLFRCPVIYVEPYVMNSRAAFQRIQAGDYPDRKKIDGKLQPSIYREYADSITAGLVDYYSRR